jgi:hypothetical protein
MRPGSKIALRSSPASGLKTLGIPQAFRALVFKTIPFTPFLCIRVDEENREALLKAP